MFSNVGKEFRNKYVYIFVVAVCFVYLSQYILENRQQISKLLLTFL